MVIKIDGMMCEHCSNRVRNCLKEIENIKDVKIDLNKKEAIISINGIVNKDIVKDKIESIGYKIIEFI